MPGRLCAEVPVATISANSISVTEGAPATFTVTFDPAPASDITLYYTVTQVGDYVSSTDIGAQTLTILGGTASLTLTVPTDDDKQQEADGAVSVMLDPGIAYHTVPAEARVMVTDNDGESDELSVEVLSATCTYVRTDTYHDIYKTVITGRAAGPVGTRVGGDLIYYGFNILGTGCTAGWSSGAETYANTCEREPDDAASTTFTITLEVGGNLAGTRQARASVEWGGYYRQDIVDVLCQ